MSDSTGNLSNAPTSRSLWACVLDAGADAAEKQRSLEARMWYPVYAWWRCQSLPSKAAVAAAEASFGRWSGTEAPKNGQDSTLRMRDWVLARLNSAAKPAVVTASSGRLDEALAARRFASEPRLVPDDMFQRSWALAIFDHGVELLRTEYIAAGHTAQLGWLMTLLGSQELSDARISAIAVRTRKPDEVVRKMAEDFRARHRAIVRDLVADTVATPAEVESEITMLLCNSTLGGESPMPASEAAPTMVVQLSRSHPPVPDPTPSESAPTIKVRLADIPTRSTVVPQFKQPPPPEPEPARPSIVPIVICVLIVIAAIVCWFVLR